MTTMVPICPHLGLLDDPKTRKLFPDPCHACYQVNPPRLIILKQQHKDCLNQTYQQCEGYTTAWEEGFPKKLIGKNCAKSTATIKRRIFLILIPVILVLAFFLGLGYVLSSLPHSGVATLEGGFQIPDPTDTPIPLTPKLDLLLPISSVSTPTPTQSPTPEPTDSPTPGPTAGPALMTPFGSEGLTFAVYQVQEGDSHSLIADRYNTTVEIIEQLNINDLPTLWVGEMLVICVDCQSNPDLPPLQAVYLEEDTTLTALAADCTDCDPEQLRHWNDLGEGDQISGDRWVILPKN